MAVALHPHPPSGASTNSSIFLEFLSHKIGGKRLMNPRNVWTGFDG
jgi:hypothetical protein